jgi:hypothetical protein
MAGYNEVCARLKGIETSKDIYTPMFYVTENCMQFWRTVPSLVLDDLNPEKGPDTNQEDHVFDEVQYALMSRPFITQTGDREHEYFLELRRKTNVAETSDPYQLKRREKVRV